MSIEYSGGEVMPDGSVRLFFEVPVDQQEYYRRAVSNLNKGGRTHLLIKSDDETQVQFDNAAVTSISHREAAQPAANIVADVVYERHAQMDKWGDQTDVPMDRYFTFLIEEAGEVAKELVEKPYKQNEGETALDYRKRRLAYCMLLRTELIQLAAVAVAMVEALDAQNDDLSYS